MRHMGILGPYTPFLSIYYPNAIAIRSKTSSKAREAKLPLLLWQIYVVQSKSMLQPEEESKNPGKDIDPQKMYKNNRGPWRRCRRLIKSGADFQVFFGIIRDNSIQVLAYTPVHIFLVIYSPWIYLTVSCFGVAYELLAERRHECNLKHVERYIGNGKDLTGVGDWEADICNRKAWKVIMA